LQAFRDAGGLALPANFRFGDIVHRRCAHDDFAVKSRFPPTMTTLPLLHWFPRDRAAKRRHLARFMLSSPSA
jgi:hypothetical protein